MGNFFNYGSRCYVVRYFVAYVMTKLALLSDIILVRYRSTSITGRRDIKTQNTCFDIQSSWLGNHCEYIMVFFVGSIGNFYLGMTGIRSAVPLGMVVTNISKALGTD